jgi:lambda family phage portal protein
MAIETLFNGDIPTPPPAPPKPRVSAMQGDTFKGGQVTRLNADWTAAIISPEQKVRLTLRIMRERCRNLANNNDYAARFLNKAKENVIGSNGIGLEISLDETKIPNAKELSERIETAWTRWCEVRRGRGPTVDGKHSFIDASQLWIVSKLQDGEVFARKIKGFPYNDARFAVQFLDADQIDVNWNKFRQVTDQGQIGNEIRMGVELDQWRRPVAYHAFDMHPAETPSTMRRVRIPAEEIEHAFTFKFVNQTRGVPWMHSAMSRLNMLGQYEEAELVAARLAASKMAALQTPSGDEYVAPPAAGVDGSMEAKMGRKEIQVGPGELWELPVGYEVKPIDWNHPNVAFSEFMKAMLRGAAAGINMSYASLTGDLREVNFSSIRQGMLDEREGWKVLQTFAVEHWYKPVFSAWLPMAITSGLLDLPPNIPLDLIEDAAVWTPRGWDWVDPKKDVDADIAAIRSAQGTLKASAAKRGLDWKEILDQRAKEIAYAQELGVPLDFTTSGSGGVEGDPGGESDPNAGGQGK